MKSLILILFLGVSAQAQVYYSVKFWSTNDIGHHLEWPKEKYQQTTTNLQQGFDRVFTKAELVAHIKAIKDAEIQTIKDLKQTIRTGRKDWAALTTAQRLVVMKAIVDLQVIEIKNKEEE